MSDEPPLTERIPWRSDWENCPDDRKVLIWTPKGPILSYARLFSEEARSHYAVVTGPKKQ